MSKNVYSKNCVTNCKIWTAKMRRKPSQKCLLFLATVSLLLVYFVVLPFGHVLFDNHSLRGGELGRMIDTLGRTIIFRRMMQKRRARLDELVILLPPMKDVINKKGIPNLPQAAVAEILIRSKIRARQIQAAGASALQWSSTCYNATSAIPRRILQPDHGDFFHPVHSHGMEVIRFDHYSMRKLIQGRFPTLLPKFDGTVNQNEQTLIWCLVALYSFGGHVYGPNYKSVYDANLEDVTDSRDSCVPVSVAVFRRAASNDAVAMEMMAMASTPRHPQLKRMLESLVTEKNEIDDNMILKSIHEYYRGRDKKSDASTREQWDVFTCSCSKQAFDKDNSCCETVQHSVAERVKLQGAKDSSLRSASSQMHVKIVGSQARAQPVANSAVARVEVSIAEPAGTPSTVKVPKEVIRDKLVEMNCNVGWMCNRCLKNALFGSHDACKLLCPSCYKEIICDEPDRVRRTRVKVDVTVKETRSLAPGEKRIPKIIHQTWFDEPSVDRYPQLARLQNSWKNLGWDYRFYKDDDIRQYIASNFPPRFLDAFDSVIPGAFKADFFRYLVLLKDGGVYSDADILLDMNLDSFIAPSISFFVPRDIVGDYASENFCLWNGMMGAVPGHPFMARAAELLLTNILNRVDYYDMEREMCQSLGTNGEVWKMRALTILSLSGPCLLGSAVNKALGRSNYLSKYDPGWIIPEDSNVTSGNDRNVGDALLLIASRADMGALRFSDVDRNMMVASTGMTDLSKDPILTLEEAAQAREEEISHVHYSMFEHVNDVFGAEGIYVDNLVNNEVIRFSIARESVLD